ncbi:acetyltransferase [Nitrincola tapanii]|uniref:Acetyltransferase n=1 Tax=Nitrincola tapanii TaxID=1708751 RepID=A0A5A9W4P6_9GAMM|nr:acetyltransferase [Nitrincola tapanii]KAA0875746.1 acetyltransferase [Nitrincola tapanii]
MKRLAILGASGHGKVVADIAECCGWNEVVFFDDAWPNVSANGHWAVAGNSQTLVECVDTFTGVIIAIGNNAIRAEKLCWLSEIGAPVVTLVHPSAVISQYANLGTGTVVMPGVVVNVSSQIGDGVILNTGCSIDHDCSVGDCSHISPGVRLAGGVRIGAQSWIGIGTSVKQLVKIGQGVTVGAGAAVVTDLPDSVTAVGVPAKVI